MSELRLTRRVTRGDLRAVALLRVRFELEVAEVVGLVLPASRTPELVDRTFEHAGSHLRVGVRPDDLRTWLLVLARELALTEAREQQGPLVVPAEDLGLLAHERTLLHLHRRCGIGLDELAAALSLDRMRLWMEIVRLERRFFDTIALRLLVVEGDSRCGRFSRDSEEGGAAALVLERAREHARTCPECLERVTARLDATDTLGRAATPASLPVEAPRHAKPGRRRHSPAPVAILAVGVACAAAVAVRIAL